MTRRFLPAERQSRAELNLPLDVCFVRQQQDPSGLKARVLEVFDESKDQLYRYLLCLHLRPEEADDTIQETFLRLYQHLSAGRPESNLRGWLFRVAHNLAMNHHKSETYRPQLSDADWERATEGVCSPSPNPETRLLDQERAQQLETALANLSPQQRQCLYLRSEGFRYQEIAKILGISVSSVAEFLRRAIQRLSRGWHE
jgi:RNA polymerase sigma-70 factor, ECF subfamily